MIKTFELTPHGIQFLGCKECPRLWITPTDRSICRTRKGCINNKKPIEYSSYEIISVPPAPIFEIEEGFSAECEECGGEMWGIQERGFVCTSCGKEIDGEKDDLQEEELMI